MSIEPAESKTPSDIEQTDISSSALMREAQNYIEEGRNAKAVELLEGLINQGGLAIETRSRVLAAISEIKSSLNVDEIALEEARSCFQHGDLKGSSNILSSKTWPASLEREVILLKAAIEFAKGNYVAAADHYLCALEDEPFCCPSLSGLARCQLGMGHKEQCLQTIGRVLDIDPFHQNALITKSEVLIHQGSEKEALNILHKLVGNKPNKFIPRYRLCQLLMKIRGPRSAIDEVEKLDQLFPRDKRSWSLKAELFNQLGRHEEALVISNNLLKSDPSSTRAALCKGEALSGLDRPKEAIRMLIEASRNDPNNTEIFFLLGKISSLSGLPSLALEYFTTAFELGDRSAVCHANLGAEYCQVGDIEKGLEHTRKATLLDHKCLNHRNNLCFLMQYSPFVNSSEIFKEHLTFGRCLGDLVEHHPKGVKPCSSGRRLRVGYVSADLHTHSVSYFFTPLLEHHDRSKFEIFCYYSGKQEDETNAKLRTLADQWRDVADICDDQLSSTIRDDEIDILIDLSGHTSGNRLKVFATRSAPLQVTWLGYPNTTGLSEIDYRISDEIADPTGVSDKYHTETLYRMPNGSWCYQGDPNIRPRDNDPFKENGFITFGSFNNLQKVNTETIAAWSDILKAVPGSKLIIKGRSGGDEKIQSSILEIFQANGIDTNRIKILQWLSSKDSHLRIYDSIDIALDSMPYNGTTTTCEALWMGVPVLSLVGETPASRVGASLLERVGLRQLAATSKVELSNNAKNLAEDPELLSSVRRNLRNSIEASILCNKKRFASEFEDAISTMWASLEENVRKKEP